MCELFNEALHHPRLSGCGNKHAKMVLIGEAPGYQEDTQGFPFVGMAGQLLDNILTRIHVRREDLFITNVLRCRPENNKLPGKKDVREGCLTACLPRLMNELEKIRPKVVVTMGSVATEFLTGKRPISLVEGSFFAKPDRLPMFPAYACYHPAAALRMPTMERKIGDTLFKAAKYAGLEPVLTKTEIFQYETR